MIPSDSFQKTSAKARSLWIRPVLLLFVVLGSALVLSGCQPSDELRQEARELVKEAQGYQENSEYARAIKTYEEARKIDNANPEIYEGISSIYLLKNRTEDAKTVLLQGIDHATHTPELYRMLGEISLEQEDLDAAENYLKNALSKDKKHYQSSYLLGLTYVKQGNYELARESLDISEEGDEWYIKGALLSAITLWEDSDTASKILSQALDNENVEEDLIRQLEIYHEDLKAVSSLDENASEVYRSVILSHGALSAGYSSIVIDKLSPFVDEEKEYSDLYLYLGRAYSMETETEKAIEYLEKAVQLNPANASALWFLAREYRQGGNEEDMQSMYERAIILTDATERAVIRKEYAEVLLSAGLFDEFDEQVNALTEEYPNNAVEYALLAIRSNIDRELYDEAFEGLDAIDETTLSENSAAEYSFFKGEVLFLRGEREEALEWALDAVEKGKNIPEYHLLVGKIHFEQGDEDKATISLERAIDLDLQGNVSAEAVKLLDRM